MFGWIVITALVGTLIAVTDDDRKPKEVTPCEPDTCFVTKTTTYRMDRGRWTRSTVVDTSCTDERVEW